MTDPKQPNDAIANADFTGMHLSEIADLLNAPGDDEEIVNEQEQNEVVNEEDEGKTTEGNG